MPPGVHWVTEQWLFASIEARSLHPEYLYHPAATAAPLGIISTGGSSIRALATAGVTAQQLAKALAKALAGQGRPKPPPLCRRHYPDGSSFSLLTYNIW
jgi:hypothetical protein